MTEKELASNPVTELPDHHTSYSKEMPRLGNDIGAIPDVKRDIASPEVLASRKMVRRRNRKDSQSHRPPPPVEVPPYRCQPLLSTSSGSTEAQEGRQGAALLIDNTDSDDDDDSITSPEYHDDASLPTPDMAALTIAKNVNKDDEILKQKHNKGAFEGVVGSNFATSND